MEAGKSHQNQVKSSVNDEKQGGQMMSAPSFSLESSGASQGGDGGGGAIDAKNDTHQSIRSAMAQDAKSSDAVFDAGIKDFKSSQNGESTSKSTDSSFVEDCKCKGGEAVEAPKTGEKGGKEEPVKTPDVIAEAPKVVLPTINFGAVNSATTPAGMSHRIPPRVNTAVQVTVAGYDAAVGDIELFVENAVAANGIAQIDGAATKKMNATGSVNLSGTTQTAPGNGGKLVLAARVKGVVIARSAAFSVSSIPQDWTTTFVSLITGPKRGFVVQDGFSSDSGVFADLDQTMISEEVQYGVGTGTFAAVAGSNSGYIAGNVLTTDSHSTPVGLLSGVGSIEAQQTCIFKDLRAGDSDIPLRNSGYKITRDVTETAVGSGKFQLTTHKYGAAATANGHFSNAAAGDVSKTQLA